MCTVHIYIHIHISPLGPTSIHNVISVISCDLMSSFSHHKCLDMLGLYHQSAYIMNFLIIVACTTSMYIPLYIYIYPHSYPNESPCFIGKSSFFIQPTWSRAHVVTRTQLGKPRLSKACAKSPSNSPDQTVRGVWGVRKTAKPQKTNFFTPTKHEETRV